MQFKNDFERECYEIARRVAGDQNVLVEHNEVVVADFKPGEGVVSFTGPPKKEVDVLVATISARTKLLISAKDYATAAAPLAVQEWGSVVATMNRYSETHSHLGLLVCSRGFTSGCVAWAIASNIGLIPAQRGTKQAHLRDQVLAMFERSLSILHRMVASERHALHQGSNLYWSIYKMLSDFPED